MRLTIEEKIEIATDQMNTKTWTSPTEIGGAINGGHSSVGSPVCKKMVEMGLAERNDKGHYRLVS
ncbi:MAG: hypothetical protein KAV87_00325 [Desulfobacteraceae bacterium]|nr:hypothetical protein [Desulfobacteraceae bacterium]